MKHNIPDRVGSFFAVSFLWLVGACSIAVAGIALMGALWVCTQIAHELIELWGYL